MAAPAGASIAETRGGFAVICPQSGRDDFAAGRARIESSAVWGTRTERDGFRDQRHVIDLEREPFQNYDIVLGTAKGEILAVVPADDR